jgi:hypothetical protein
MRCLVILGLARIGHALHCTGTATSQADQLGGEKTTFRVPEQEHQYTLLRVRKSAVDKLECVAIATELALALIPIMGITLPNLGTFKPRQNIRSNSKIN